MKREAKVDKLEAEILILKTFVQEKCSHTMNHVFNCNNKNKTKNCKY